MAENLNISADTNDSVFRRVFDDASVFIDNMENEHEIMPYILKMMKSGDASVELKKRYMLRAIDEAWVNIIEDTLPALDVIIRNPSKFIEEREEVLPIELTRNISVRSLQHLSQHTNYISKIEGDKITPTKILNVYREETLQTYENKFINTLINRLYIFVNRRYQIAKKAGQDEKTTSLEFSDSFDHASVRVNMNFKLEIAENAEDGEDKPDRNYLYTTDIWRRVEKLHQVVNTYAESEFVQNMGQSYIRPPVMRTNAILKNKNMRQCLALWQFIESYENAGYSMLVQENLEKIDEKYIKEIYSSLALQYLIFRHNINKEFEIDATLAIQITEELHPKIVEQITDAGNADEFDVDVEKRVPMPSVTRRLTMTPDDELMAQSLDIALDTAAVMRENGQDEYTVPVYIEEPEPVPEYVDPEPEETEEEEAEEPKPTIADYAAIINGLVNKFPSATDNDEIRSIKDEILETLDNIKIEEEGSEEDEEEPVRENLPPLKKKRSKSRKRIRRPYNKTKIKG